MLSQSRLKEYRQPIVNDGTMSIDTGLISGSVHSKLIWRCYEYIVRQLNISVDMMNDCYTENMASTLFSSLSLFLRVFTDVIFRKRWPQAGS